MKTMHGEAGMVFISEWTALERSHILEKGLPAKADLIFGKKTKVAKCQVG